MFLQIEVTCILSVRFLNTKDFRKKGKNDFDIIGDGHICEISKQNPFSLFFFFFFLSLNQLVMQSPRASKRQSVTVSQLLLKSNSKLLSYSLD